VIPSDVPRVVLSASGQFLRGASAPVSALWYAVRHPSLVPWMAAPLLLTLMAIAAAATATAIGVPVFATWLVPQPDTPLGLALWWMGVVWAWIFLFAASAVVCWVIGRILASPFYDVVAGRIEEIETGRSPAPVDWATVRDDVVRGALHSAFGLAIYLTVLVFLFLLNVIPFVGSAVSAVLSVPVTIAFVAREVFDIPLSRRRLGFGQKLRWLWTHRPAVAGLGAVTALALLVPLANLVVLPIAVVAAVRIVVAVERSESEETAPA
jgi:CysZ protein